MMTSRRFLVSFAVWAVLVMASVPLFNLVIDPFGIFRIVNINGINAQRLQASALSRIAKPTRACVVAPVSALLGTSRVEVGMNPIHPGWHQEGPAFNLALPGTGIAELEMTLRHLMRASPRLKEVNIGIDFLMFNANREAVVFGTEVFNFDPGRLLLNPGDTCLKTYVSGLWDILGPPAVRYGLSTIASQFAPQDLDPIAANRRGAWQAQNDANGYRGDYFTVLLQQAHKSGFRSIFGVQAGQETSYVRSIWRPLPTERYCLTAPGQRSTLEVFRDLARVSQQSGVKVTIFINPIHARLLIALREAGLWPIYEDWKRGLVAVNEEVAAETGNRPLPLWDFSGFNTITTERIPERGDTSFDMQYWWESSHYREAAGTLMLDRMLDYHSPDRQVPNDFGILLTPQSIDDWILRTRAGALKYMTDFPDVRDLVVTAIADVLKDAKGTSCGFDVAALFEGNTLVQQGDTAGAEERFDEAIQLHESDEMHYAELAVPYREGRFPEQLALARQGQLQVSLNSWREYLARAHQREDAGTFEAALRDYDDAVRLAPRQSNLYPARGQLKLKMADYRGAMTDFKQALAITPDNEAISTLTETTLGLWKPEVITAAQAALEAKEYAQAIEALEPLIEFVPDDPEVNGLLASARKSGDGDETTAN